MKKLTFLFLALLLFSSCEEELPNLPPEYDYIKGEWVAYETTVCTSDLHYGYIYHTKTINNYQNILYFKDYSYEQIVENISREYDLSDLYVRFTSDTNCINFRTTISYYYYKNEDIIKWGNGLAFFFPEIPYSAIVGGHTYYRRVQ